jgi:tetratricopeptide (TPR) repeat protein
MYNYVFFPLFVLLTFVTASAQQTTETCEQACSRNYAECHYEHAQVLLTGTRQDASDCLRLYEKNIASMDNLKRVQESVTELDAAIIGESWPEATKTRLQFEKAASLIAEAGMQVNRGEISVASAALSRACDIYVAQASSQINQGNDDTTAQLATGFLRCGRPISGLETLNRLQKNSSEKMYLTAELLFAIGQREEAAVAYEKWIAAGCISPLDMLSKNEFGEKWTFMYMTSPPGQTKCQQLPSELRIRLETLQGEFAHPANLPKKSYPARPFPVTR